MEKKVKQIFSTLSAFVVAIAAIPTTYHSAAAEEKIEEVIGESTAAYIVEATDETQVVVQSEETSGTCGENLTWNYDVDSKTLIINGTGKMNDWSYGNYAPWYSDHEEISKVVLQNGVTSIGKYSFYGCTGLTDVTIPNSVTNIGDETFSGCSNITSITIPDSVTNIGEHAFEDCWNLTSITISDSITSIEDGTFSGCSSITSITIPDSVTSIGAYAFFECSSLTDITIPDSVTFMGGYVFGHCLNLTNITIPYGVTSIGKCAFLFCTSLTDITIPNSVISIGYWAFMGCKNLTDIIIPNNVTDIEKSAFSGTLWLKAKQVENPLVIVNGILIDGTTCTGEVIIPNSVMSIGREAFNECAEMISVTIPNSVTSIGYSAFKNCKSLSQITIPDSVTSIGEYAFRNCKSLTSVIIPNNVTSIGEYTFSDCESLTSIIIPNSVTSIAKSTFSNCSELMAVTISNPYCKIYDDKSTISDTATIYSYPNSLAKNYAEKYNRKFVVLDGEPTIKFSYEITPLLSPFNEYFFVKTDNPDPKSFRFADKDSVYSDDSVIALSTTQFADVKYDNLETLRVSNGYIFYSNSTDGGEVFLQIKSLNGSWEDLGLKLTLPTLYDEVDYLINTYATKSSFFANMGAVQSGFSSICLYSGSNIRGELYKSASFWSVTANTHIDQSFYIYSPYSRHSNKTLFASTIYPFRYDSLGFPSIMATVSQRLDNLSSWKWSDSNHYTIYVTYDDETRSYGGAGNGKGQGLTEDKITRFFTFDDSEEAITLDNIRQLLDDYAEVEMEDDIPREDSLTWANICDTVCDGAWARVGGGYAYFYKRNDQNYYQADKWGVGNSIYWYGSLGYGSDTWVDGRYIGNYEVYIPGERFENHPESSIILQGVVLPDITYDRTRIYNSKTGEYEYVYSNINIIEAIKTVKYYYNSTEKLWRIDSDVVSSSTYSTIVNMTKQGLIDEKYLDALELTYDEVIALGVDRNTNQNPEYGYIYDGTVKPGTRFGKAPTYTPGDANCDGVVNIADAVLIMQFQINPDRYGLNGYESGHITEQGMINGDVIGNDGITNKDALSIQRYLLELIEKLPEE